MALSDGSSGWTELGTAESEHVATKDSPGELNAGVRRFWCRPGRPSHRRSPANVENEDKGYPNVERDPRDTVEFLFVLLVDFFLSKYTHSVRDSY